MSPCGKEVFSSLRTSILSMITRSLEPHLDVDVECPALVRRNHMMVISRTKSTLTFGLRRGRTAISVGLLCGVIFLTTVLWFGFSLIRCLLRHVFHLVNDLTILRKKFSRFGWLLNVLPFVNKCSTKWPDLFDGVVNSKKFPPMLMVDVKS